MLYFFQKYERFFLEIFAGFTAKILIYSASIRILKSDFIRDHVFCSEFFAFIKWVGEVI